MIDVNTLKPFTKLEWIKGDKLGDIDVIQEIEETASFTWVNFFGGSRINIAVISEYMNVIGIVPEDEIDTFINHKKQEQQKQQEVVSEPISPVINIKNDSKAIEIKEENDPNHFYNSILKKAKLDTNFTIDIKLSFDFLSSEQINMLVSLYGEDMNEAIAKFVASKMTDDIVSNSVYDALGFTKTEEPTESETKEEITED